MSELITNEEIFTRLGWELLDEVWWTQTGEHFSKYKLPDPLNDLNATFNYVVPQLIKAGVFGLCWNVYSKDEWAAEVGSDITGVDKNPALAICEAFMNLEVKELTPT